MADRDISNRKRITRIVLVSVFFSTLGISLLSFVFPLLSLDQKAGGLWLGSAFAGYYLAKLAVSPLAGLWADGRGARQPLLAATAIGALLPLGYFLWPSVNSLYFLQFAMGFVGGIIRPVHLAVLGKEGRGSLGSGFGYYAFWLGGALFLGPFLGGALYLNRTMEPVLAVLSGCMLLALVAATRLPAGGVAERESPDVAATTGGDMWALFTAICGRTLGIGAMAAFYPVLLSSALTRHGLTVAALFSLPVLVSAVMAPAMGRLVTDPSRRLWTVTGMLVSAAGLYLLGVVTSVWGFGLTGVLMGLGSALSVPASMALAASLGPRRGRVFGLAQLAAGLGLLLGPLVAGGLVQATLPLGRAFQLAALLGVAGCGPLLVRELRQRLHLGGALSVVLAGSLLVVGGAHFGLQSHGVFISREDGLHSFTQVAMGTVVNMTLDGDENVARRAAARALDAMRQLQEQYDHRNHLGDIGQVNHLAGRSPVRVSEETFRLVGRALMFARFSNGAFDPTVGAVTTNPLYYMLDDALLEARKDLVNFRLVRLDPAERQVYLVREGMALDLGGIAKGTIIDEAVKVLRKGGVVSGMVEAGGDFYCFGPRTWTVGVRDPRSEGVLGTVEVREKGVCGSGDYQQFTMVEQDGKEIRKHHILDATTLHSATEVTGVTVVADSAEIADALATTLFILGPEKGKTLLDAHFSDARALWVLKGGSAVGSQEFFKE